MFASSPDNLGKGHSLGKLPVSKDCKDNGQEACSLGKGLQEALEKAEDDMRQEAWEGIPARLHRWWQASPHC